MSLRWFARADLYERDEEQIRILFEKLPGVGVRVSADVIYYMYFDDEGQANLCQEKALEPKIFEQMTAAEMFISRFKKDCKVKVDSLLERTYYFGRQNSHYQKEVE